MKSLLTALLLLASFSAAAEIYKWTDSHGVVHYTDKQPDQNDPAPAGKVEKLELSPIQILDNGSVENKGSEDSSQLARWLGQAEELRIQVMNRIAIWTGTTPPAASGKAATVEIYTTSWCGACKKAKQWLRDNGVAFKEYDVQKDANAALRMRQLGGGGGVPFTVINGQTFQGFSPAQYKAALR